MTSPIKRVALLFAGGPAPGANAVISTAAFAFLKVGVEVVGIKHGYSKLIDFDGSRELVEGQDYIRITHDDLHHSRTSQGIMIGTARTNPGKLVSSPKHLHDAERIAPIKRVCAAFRSLGVDALISIGGDDTLKTANKLKMYQALLPPEEKKFPVVHLPKTIDNDYMGIDFTFGYFTAVETLASEMRNLSYDAAAGQVYYLCEAMGRSAGWLAYGAAIAGEACMVVSVEDIVGEYRSEEMVVNPDGSQRKHTILVVDKLVAKIVRMMQLREQQKRPYGVIVVAEGVAEYLPHKYLEDAPRDDHGHLSVASINLGKLMAKFVMDGYKAATGKSRKVTGLQLGYESRCASPHAFDVMLGSQIGVGAYRALMEKNLNGVMVSVGGQLNIQYVPFEDLVDPDTLVTKVRYIERDSDFHRLARFVESCADD